MAMQTYSLPADGSWTKIADAADDPITAQAKTRDGIEVWFADSAPSVHDEGLSIPQFAAVTRTHGTGSLYARPLKHPGRDRSGAVVVVVT